jgi:predicted O-methyltransferase YrrM
MRIGPWGLPHNIAKRRLAALPKCDAPLILGQDVVVERRQQQVREVIERLTSSGTATAQSDGSEHILFPVAASAAEGENLRDWVLHESAARTIEIGLGYGISALFVCEGLIAEGHDASVHVVIDPHQATRFANLGLQFLDEAGVADLVEHHPEESQIVLPRLLAASETFDLAFVDGNHRFEWFLVDLFFLGRLVRPGGVVFIDDYQLPAIARATSFFLANRGWKLESVSPADDLHQWAVLRTDVEPDTRPFTHFVDF